MKKVFSVLCIAAILLVTLTNFVYADDPRDMSTLISSMKDSGTMANTDSRIGNVINNVIGLLQMVGSGIALIVITLLGMKYILASPSEKADVKKAVMPIIIGCILLFGAVNLMAAVANFASII